MVVTPCRFDPGSGHSNEQNMPIEKLQLPTFDYQLITENGKTYIYDIIRKKYVCLTPEEWVRQHIMHYLINHKGYKTTLMSVERSFNKAGRADLLIYDTSAQLYMLVECKAPTAKLNFKTINQVVRYNSNVKSPFITITNGIRHFCFKKKDTKYELLTEIPFFSD